MKQSTVQKMADYEQDNVDQAETMIGAKIGWQEIDEEKGRGVVARADIKKGEIVEISPVLPVSKNIIPDDGGAPDGYLLDWDPDTEGEEHCMPLGYIMMYNHSNQPNIHLEQDTEALTITARAMRDIKRGEELTWDYACELWFDEA